MGIAAQKQDYGQQAIIGNLVPEKPIENRAYERFTPQGPLAVLPLAGDRVGFIWTVSAADADRVLQLDDADFLAELQQEFGYRLGRLALVCRTR